ncbi:MAG: peptidylprolyl isomerase [Bacillota bacterium]|nr:peptidylprolyl isomerase [Bacillota bacterium]
MKFSKVLLILLSLILVFNLAACSSGPSDVVATIGSEKITLPEFKFFVNLVKADMESTAGLASATDADKKKFWDGNEGTEPRKTLVKTKALEKLQEMKLLLINAKKEKYKLEKADLDNVKSSIDQLIQQEGKGKRADADKAVQQKFSITLDQYEAIFKDYTLAYNKYANDLVKGLTIKDEDVKAYFDKNTATYDKEKRTVKHVLIMTQDSEGKALAADKLKEKEKLANDILSKAKAGTDFDSLVKQYSEDPGSKDKNGQYSFGKGEMVKEFEDFAFNPNVKEGDIGMVKSTYGYHIIKFIKTGTTFDSEKDKIKQQLQSDGMKSMIDKWKAEKGNELKKNQSVIDKVTV